MKIEKKNVNEIVKYVVERSHDNGKDPKEEKLSYSLQLKLTAHKV